MKSFKAIAFIRTSCLVYAMLTILGGCTGGGLPRELAELDPVRDSFDYIEIPVDSLPSELAKFNPVRDSFDYIEIPVESLPNYYNRIDFSDAYYPPLDADSVELFDYHLKQYYHPTFLAHRCQNFIGTYYATKDIKYLNRCKKSAQKIMTECVLVDDGVPYLKVMFDYQLHGDSTIKFEPPWVSGMSQGEVISVMMHLFEITNDSVYYKFGDDLFKAYLRPQGEHDYWNCRIDSSGYYWMEEYPHDEKPGRTLNGYIGAIYGIYDYYRVTGTPEAKAIYDLSLTTIKKYLPQFRIKGNYSYYCLGHQAKTNAGYHSLHVKMLRNLYRMSGDEYFEAMADLFEYDGNAAAEREEG
jgi:hypothetical protein